MHKMSFRECIDCHAHSHPALIFDNENYISWGQLRYFMRSIEQKQNFLDRGVTVKIGADANLENILLFVYALYFRINVEMSASSETSQLSDDIQSMLFEALDDAGEAPLLRDLPNNKHIAFDKIETLVIETSGTTGVRKKIIHSFRALEFQAKAVSELLELTSDDRQLAYMPLNYIYGMSIIYTWLYSGSKLVISKYGPQAMSKFFQEIVRSKISVFSGVPFTYLLMKKWGIGKLRRSNIRSLTQAGGYLPNNIKETILEELQETRFIVMYGQTEFCGRISQGEVKLGLQDSFVGKLLDGLDAIIDENEVLYISSPSICLNADEFMPKKVVGGKTYYSTGDIAKLDDTQLSIRGRNKNFIKVGGHRIPQDTIISLIEKDSRVNSVFLTNGIYKTEKVLIGINIDSLSEHEGNKQNTFHLDAEVKSDLREILGNVGYEIILLSGNLPTLNNGKFDMTKITNTLREAYIGKKSIHFWL